VDWLKPANLVLALTLLCAAWIFARSKVNLAESLQDDAGRFSSARLFAFGAFASSTWVLMLHGVAEKMSDWMWYGYLAAWSGSAVLSKAIDAWKAK